MTRAALVLVTLALAAALFVEARRYGAERELRRTTTVFRAVATRAVPERSRILDAVVTHATAVAAVLPGDSRSLVLAGAARLVDRRAADALALYRRALATGERAEIDLNLARAHAVLGDEPAAHAALLRAVWVSPALLDVLPPPDRERMRRALKDAGRALRAGRAAPPPLPAGDAP
jgi:hypothetical protein